MPQVQLTSCITQPQVSYSAMTTPPVCKRCAGVPVGAHAPGLMASWGSLPAPATWRRARRRVCRPPLSVTWHSSCRDRAIPSSPASAAALLASRRAGIHVLPPRATVLHVPYLSCLPVVVRRQQLQRPDRGWDSNVVH